MHRHDQPDNSHHSSDMPAQGREVGKSANAPQQRHDRQDQVPSNPTRWSAGGGSTTYQQHQSEGAHPSSSEHPNHQEHGVLAPNGVTLSPAIGAALMRLSTIVVALNAQLLRRVDIRPETQAG